MKGPGAKDTALCLDWCVLSRGFLASLLLGSQQRGRQSGSHRRDEVQLPRASVDVHPQLAVHASVPHAVLLHPLTLHTDALHTLIHLHDKVHAHTVQLDTLHAITPHVHLQGCVDVRPLVQQGLTVQFNTARAGTGASGTRDTRHTRKEDCALPQ